MLRILFGFLLGALSMSALPTWAQSFPDRPVQIVVAYPPGGGSDALSRLLAPKLEKIWGQPVVVTNRPGAQGNIGTSYALRANPDGYTILALITSSAVINPHIYENTGFNPIDDAAPIIRATRQPMILVANPNIPVETLKDIEELARAQPGKLSFGSTAAQLELLGEHFKHTRKIDLLHVPYNGAGPAFTAILGGTIDLLIGGTTAAIPQINAGKLRGVAILDRDRVPSLPDVPSAQESGYPEFNDLIEWYGYAAPAGTPPEIIAKLHAGFMQALEDPEVQAGIQSRGFKVAPSTPEEFADQIKQDYERWGELVKTTGVKGRSQ